MPGLCSRLKRILTRIQRPIKMLTHTPLTIERVSNTMERKRVTPHTPLAHR